MIEINLLPEELRIKKKTIRIDSRMIIYIIPLILGSLFLLHAYLIIALFAKTSFLRGLDNKWKEFEPKQKIVEGFKKEQNLLLQNIQTIQAFNSQRINYAEKLNRLSLDLPLGIWFTDVSLANKNFVLKGSVVSLQKEELGLINKFFVNLKSDTAFSKDFNDLGVSSIQRKVIGVYDVVDFILSGKLK